MSKYDILAHILDLEVIMTQLSLYLDPSTMEYLRKEASSQDCSLSKYVANIIKDRSVSAWPKNFFDLYGTIDDESFLAPLELDFSLDTPRPSW